MLVFLSGCMPAGPKALIEGDRLLQEGKYSEAIPKLAAAIEVLPKDSQKAIAWNRLGLAYQQTGEVEKSAQAYQQALKLDRDLAEARFNLGCLQLEQGNAPAAIEALTTYATLQPHDSNGWLKLGEANLQRAFKSSGRERTAQLDAAKKNLEQSSKLAPSAEASNGLGIVAFEKGRIADALKLFQSALQMQPGFPAAMLNSAVAHHSFRDPNERRLALKLYRDYLATNPRDAVEVDTVIKQLEAESNAGVRPAVSSATNKTEIARSDVAIAGNGAKSGVPRYKYLSPARPAAGNRTEANRFFSAGLDAQKAKRLSEAADNYRKALRSDGSFFEAHYNLELIEFERGNLSAALNEAETALALAGGSVNARYNFALALDKAGFAQDAAKELEKVLAQSPGEARAHLLLGSLYAQKLNDVAKARAHFMKVLELEPQHAQAAAIRNWLAGNR